jgi:hypothetical protein
MTMRSRRLHRHVFVLAALCVVSACAWGCSSEPSNDATKPANGESATATASGGGARITGIAFVDSTVTSQGAAATLPPGTEVHPSGSKITGTDGCPTNRHRTDGLIVAVIDYEGRPTSGALTVVENREGGGRISRAPYYLDLDSGRKLQFLGPTFDNGTYDLKLVYDYSHGSKKSATGQFVLARQCPKVK